MANNENLRPWKKGQSGNPAGKPKGTRHISTLIREMLEDPNFTYELKGEKVTGMAGEAIIYVLIHKALRGDLRAFELLAKYGYSSKELPSNQHQPAPILSYVKNI